MEHLRSQPPLANLPPHGVAVQDAAAGAADGGASAGAVAGEVPVSLAERIIPQMLPGVTGAFAGPDGTQLIPFLAALKSARAQRLAQERTRPGPIPHATVAPPPRNHVLVAQALAQLRLPSPAEEQRVLRAYAQLQDAVAPLLGELAAAPRVVAPRHSLDQERADRVGYGQLRALEVLVTFDWEPVARDPLGTTTHFVRSALQAAFHNFADYKQDSRGSEVQGDGELPDDLLFGAGADSVEAQVQENETLALLAAACADDPTLRAVAWGHVIEGASLPQLAGELNLPLPAVQRAWATLRQRLAAALVAEHAAEQEEAAEDAVVEETGVAEAPTPPDGPAPAWRGRGVLSPLWAELATHPDHYRALLGRWGAQCLLASQHAIFDAALDHATGERESTIVAVTTALGGRYTSAFVRRQIQMAAALLERTVTRQPGQGSWMTKEGRWRQQRAALIQLRADPVFWDGLTPQLQEIIERYYVDPPTRPSQEAVGAQLSRPLDGSSVSRQLSRLVKQLGL